MANNPIQKQDRYPGIRSFEIEDANIFFGRSAEIEELFSLVKIKPLVVLFGKSGLGKSSLIKAGLAPGLLAEPFIPILTRVQDTGISPIDSIIHELEPWIDREKQGRFGGKSTNNLWEAFRACNFKDAAGNPAVPVLIIDQFEELFLHRQEVVHDWANQLATLIDERIPGDVRSMLLDVPRKERTPELLEWCSPPEVRVLLAIRSDKMSHLHELRHFIPGILQNRYEIKALNGAAAREAIKRPAAQTDEHFRTAPFRYSPDTLELIEKSLSNEYGEIESFQLQIICRYIENEVDQIEDDGHGDIVVTPSYLGGQGGINKILKNYYERQLSTLGGEDMVMAARRLIEEGLIIDGRRISLPGAVIQKNFGVDFILLDKLMFSRLIRPENTRTGRTYEISHDTLVSPIREAYEKRKIREEADALRLENEKKLEEERLKLEEEKKKRRKMLSNIIFYFALGAIAFLFVLIFLFRSIEAKKKAEAGIQRARLSYLSSQPWLYIRKENTKAFHLGMQSLTSNGLIDSILQNNPDIDIEKELEFASASLSAILDPKEKFRFYDKSYRVEEGWITCLAKRQKQDTLLALTGNIKGNASLLYLNKKGKILKKVNFEDQDKSKNHDKALWAVDISADAKRFLTCSTDGTAIVWGENGNFLQKLPHATVCHDSISPPDVLSAALSPDGNKAITGGANGTIILWNISNLESGISLGDKIDTAHAGFVRTMDISESGNLLVTGGWDGKMILWKIDGDSLNKLTTYKFNSISTVITEAEEVNPVKIMSIAFSPDEKKIISGDMDSLFRIWDVDTTAVIDSFHWVDSYLAPIYNVSWSHCGNYYFVGCDDNSITWRPYSSVRKKVFMGHESKNVSAIALMDTSYFLSTSRDNTVKVWNINEFEDRMKVLAKDLNQPQALAISISPKDTTLLTGCNNGEILVFGAKEKTSPRTIDTLRAHSVTINNIALSDDGMHMLSCSSDSSAYAVLWKFEASLSSYIIVDTLTGHSDRVNGAVFLHGKNAFVSVSDDQQGIIRYYDNDWNFDHEVRLEGQNKTIGSSGLELSARWAGPLKGHIKTIWSVDVNEDNEIITCSSDSTIIRWNEEGIPIQKMSGHKGQVYCVKYCSDGQTILSGGADKRLLVWQKKGRDFILRDSIPMLGKLRNIDLLPDIRNVLITFLESNVPPRLTYFTGRLEQAEKDRIEYTEPVWPVTLQQFLGHNSRVRDIQFVGNSNKEAVSISDDGSIRYWRTVFGMGAWDDINKLEQKVYDWQLLNQITSKLSISPQ